MKTKHLIPLAALCGFLGTVHAQTPPLTPSGPPSDPSTAMKSLNQVEPRTPIGSLPFTISQPGSYYFTKNLEFTAATGHAITVNSNNVSIDMMGFTLSSTAPVTGWGIFIAGDNVAVTNGMIKGTTVINTTTWTATPGGFGRGVACEESGHQGRNWHLSRLFVSGCRGTGIRGFYNATIEDCNISGNGLHGIEVHVICNIRRCIVSQNGGNSVGGTGHGIESFGNITVSDCIAEGNEGYGINAQASTVTNCAAISNGQFGIAVGTGVVAFCRASGNNGGDSNSQIAASTGTRTGNLPSP